MENITKEELKEIVGTAVQDTMKREFKSFYIPPEKHYKEHEFIEKLMGLIEGCKTNIGKALASIFVYGIIALLLLGIGTWFVTFCLKMKITGGSPTP